MAYIREYNGEKLAEDVVKKLVESMEEITDEQKDRLIQIVNRKKSFSKSILKYQELTQSKKELIKLLKELLGDYFDTTHEEYSLEELTIEYAEEFSYAEEDWWVFKQVTNELDNYNIVLSHAENVGYKRGVRGEDNRPNELYKSSPDGEIEINTESPGTILDEFVINISWR